VIFRATPLEGAYVVEQERIVDKRGFFARTWATEELASRGLDARAVHMNTSFNAHKGTVRGLHFQVAPYEEAKLVRATRGAIWDVAVDLREDSPTYRRWHAVELTEDNGVGFYIPPGFAHGFQSLTDASEVLYVISAAYQPGASAGVRWDDPAIGIRWPAAPGRGRTISVRDRTWPDLPT
jgi:dTDP-4-dehydrorhamnose 3,5-epimerase